MLVFGFAGWSRSGKTMLIERLIPRFVARGLADNAPRLCTGAVIYVCGDASRMAKDVDAALQAIVATHGRRSAARAQLELREWAAEGRYVRDVY